MVHTSERRKRKRKPTSNGRFIGSQLAYELGLVRIAIQVEREFKAQNSRQDFEKKSQ